MDVAGRMGMVRELCESFPRRRAGTDAERRAANRVAERLGKAGRRAEVEPIHVHPQWPLVHALHCALGVAASLLAVLSAPVAFALALATATSMYLDLNGRLYLLRTLFFRRASQNVLARGPRPEAPARLILCAHLDAPRSGLIYEPRWLRRGAAAFRALPGPYGFFRPLFWSLALLLPLLGLRMAGIESEIVSVAQIPPTVILLAGVFALLDIQLSGTTPAANGNASGTATVASLAEELDRDPPEDLDVWVLLTGGGHCLMQGMRSFLRSHRDELAECPTTFVCIDSVGAGEPRYLTSEGLVFGLATPARLVELCEAIAEPGEAGAARSGFATDAFAARFADHPAIAITCMDPDGVLPPHSHRPSDLPEALEAESMDGAHELALALVRALDRERGAAVTAA